MKTELINSSPVHKEIKITLETAEIKPVYDQVVQRYARLATVPGFRRGYAPRDIVKTRFREDIQNETLRDLLPNRVTEAIQEHNLHPLSEPQLHIENAESLNLTTNADLHLHVHVEVMPVLETPNYKGFEAVRRVRPVADDEIEKMIEGRRSEQASLIPIEDRAAEVGDTVNVDVDGKFVGDEEAEPIQVEDLAVELGGAGVQQEFTDNLIGVQPDETRNFTITYPEDFSSAGLAGKTLEYAAKVKSVGRVELPEVNDEWAQSLSEGEENYESIADLRGKLRLNLESMAKMEADNKLRDELMNKMIEANPIEVPPTLTNYQAQGLTQQFTQNMEQQGIDMRQADEKLLQMLYQRMLPQAEREVRGALLLDKIAEVENIQVSADEVTTEFEAIAKYSGRTADEVREILTQQENGEANINERLRNRKAIELLVDNAVIADGEWEEEAAEEMSEETLETDDTPEITAATATDNENNVEAAEQTTTETPIAAPKKNKKKAKEETSAETGEGESATA
ncbi:MAG: trigger factor [Pyrinomonadaceae bacterium]